MATRKTEKKLASIIKLQIPAGEANPAPPIGPALGQRGLNIAGFCKSFNALTADREKGLLLPVVISAYEDRSFEFVVKTPPTAVLIKRALGVDKGSAVPHTSKIGKLSRAQVEEIAHVKMPDLNTVALEAAVRVVAGTARSMGVDVEEAA